MRPSVASISLLLVAALASAQNKPEHAIIYREEGIYACFPSLVKLDDGRLFTGFATRKHASHIDPEGGTMNMISSDGGRTWTETKESFPDPLFRRGDGSYARAAADGWQYVSDEKLPQLKRDKRTIMGVRKGTSAYLGGAHASISLDDGKTWTRREIDIPSDISGLMGYNNAANVRTRDGVRLVAVYGKLKADPRHRVFILRSADDGQTWTFIPVTPNMGEWVGGNETALAELPGGDILAMIRSNKQECLYRSTSSDRGVTWTEPEKTSITGYPAHLLALADNKVVCTYGYRAAPMGIRACVSTDGGITFDTRNEIILRDDARGRGADLGYPITVQLDTGELFTIYYFTDGKATHIASTRWRIP